MENSDQHEDSPQPKTSPDLPTLCYQIAYFALPRLVFAQPQRTIGYFTQTEYPAAAYLYVMATRVLDMEPVREHLPLFKVHNGELSATRNYHILEYPVPPPFELGSGSSVLAPFFSAIIAEKTTEEVAYYTLGQNPVNGTTLRSVMPNGVNANLGPGPLPELDAFMQALQSKA